MKTHIHKYKIDSEMERGHKHKIIGYADVMLGVSSLHFHFFSGVSSYCNHTHYFSGFTSFPVKTENGHVHKIETLLDNNDLHEHKIAGFTFEEISYISGNVAKEAYI
jgi:hypothetical protein